MEELNGLKYAVCDSKSPKVTTPGKDKLVNSKGTPKDYRSNFQKGTRLKTTRKTKDSMRVKRPKKDKEHSGACSSNSNSPKSVSHDTPNTSSASVAAKSTPASSKSVNKSRSRKIQRPTENVFDGIRRTLSDRRSIVKSVPSLCGPRKDLTAEDPLDCVDNFRLDAIIGEGTFGQVFRGECKATKSLVALKKVSKTKNIYISTKRQGTNGSRERRIPNHGYSRSQAFDKAQSSKCRRSENSRSSQRSVFLLSSVRIRR